MRKQWCSTVLEYSFCLAVLYRSAGRISTRRTSGGRFLAVLFRWRSSTGAGGAAAASSVHCSECIPGESDSVGEPCWWERPVGATRPICSASRHSTRDDTRAVHQWGAVQCSAGSARPLRGATQCSAQQCWAAQCSTAVRCPPPCWGQDCSPDIRGAVRCSAMAVQCRQYSAMLRQCGGQPAVMRPAEL